jgi:predicted  nucleic acid-binding Zn-ribbon protein
MLSNNAEFKNLLLLHSRDRRINSLENELQNLPKAMARLDHSIDIEKESIAIATTELRTLETRNKTLDGEITAIGEQILGQKNKQLQVKKNEEYQALENEIANRASKVNEKEDEQIEVLIKIDDARQTAKIAKEKITLRVVDLEKQRSGLADRENELKQDIGELSQEISRSRQEVEVQMLEVYDRTKKILTKPPYIAPIEDQKCSGCNLRVSNDVVSSVLVEQKLTQCDQCGRIVYVVR